jgi:hypothetical protein
MKFYIKTHEILTWKMQNKGYLLQKIKPFLYVFIHFFQISLMIYTSTKFTIVYKFISYEFGKKKIA